MKRLLILLLLIAVAFSGCTEKQPGAKEPSPDEVKMLMIGSANGLDSYRFSTESIQKIMVFNRSMQDTNISTIMVTAVGNGDMDLAGRTMRMGQSINMESGDNNPAPGKSETYILNDTIYMSMDGNWTSLKIPDADLIWDRQNIVRNQAELINNSEISFLGEETVDGQDTYKVKVMPDQDTYSAVLAEQVGSILPVAALNLSETYRSSPPEWTSWITKDGYLLKKNEIRMNLSVAPEDMGLRPEDVGDFEMVVDLATTTVFLDFNQPVEIALPEDAKNATVMTLLPASDLPQATDATA
jgi:hypothetical protein